MADGDTGYGSKTAITITLTSLADQASRQSTVWNTTTGNQIDEMILVKSNGGSASCVDYGFVYAAGALDNTDNEFTDVIGTTDATFATGNIKNSPFLGSLLYAGTSIVRAGPFSAASAFGGFLPAAVGLIFNNESGAALSATATDHELEYIPVYLSAA